MQMSEQQIQTAANMPNTYNFDELQPIDADDIIDVAAFDFTDEQRWLCVAANCPPEGRVQNLHDWLVNGPALDLDESESLNGTRKSIDTRTFTRPKKRSNRLSFESIIEALSPSVENVWQRPSPTIEGSNPQMENEVISITNRRESVPAMLKLTPAAAASFSAKSGVFNGSGQESMEAFLNSSQSKGIDSFINLTEPEFSDALMNVSQPSDLSSSLADTSKESLPHGESIVDSQILTESMMKTSMFGDVSDSKDFNDETFLKSFENNTTLKKSNIDENDTLSTDFKTTQIANLNSTFNTFTRRSASSLPRQSLPLDIEKQTINTTFTSIPIDNKVDLDETLIKSPSHDNKLSNGLRGTLMSQQQTLETINITLDLNHGLSDHTCDRDADIEPNFSSIENINIDTTISHATMNPIFNGPTALRRELLEQVQRSSEQILDSTYSHTVEDRMSDISTINHNNTYRKNPSKIRNIDPNKPANFGVPISHNDKKYYTFTKKTNVNVPKADLQSQPSLESLDNTFCKPASNYQKKLRAPRVLSKVPQLFQKSNPNLATNSLRSFDARRCSNIPNSNYGRGGQSDVPRNVEGTLINKLLPLGRLKSGSEQRLLDVGGSIKEFYSKGACGSTESIESTQSAHSAPDLDDRLSVCSDSSQPSYNSRVINSAQLHYIARLQEESLKQISTPKPNRRVMENTWVETEKDLPSPILKGASNQRNPDITASHTVKTSSPILSPVSSSTQPVGTAANYVTDMPNVVTYQGQNNIIRKPEMLVRPMKHTGLESKTRLRAPTNWSVPTRMSGAGSGIPRPASRIPGPRFSRPNHSNNQTDWKKGCL
ncbi:uncharacterized protein LOC105685866 isoform X1 [Athalia rosae]|uniref:uncharacterized protein LOC105685866 isoform X1 n=2 Tax=Athalia rosae TaxID=37344 RepID=UPI002033F4CE|nr:uncharacterized protein LOC105685866 isoform X1 [Athalia rosae]